MAKLRLLAESLSYRLSHTIWTCSESMRAHRVCGQRRATLTAGAFIHRLTAAFRMWSHMSASPSTYWEYSVWLGRFLGRGETPSAWNIHQRHFLFGVEFSSVGAHNLQVFADSTTYIVVILVWFVISYFSVHFPHRESQKVKASVWLACMAPMDQRLLSEPC